MHTLTHGFTLLNSQSLHKGSRGTEHFQTLLLTVRGAPLFKVQELIPTLARCCDSEGRLENPACLFTLGEVHEVI